MRDLQKEFEIIPIHDHFTGEDLEFQFCKRETWGARPPSGPAPPLTHPVTNVRFTDTKTLTCSYDYKECASILRELQRKHMEEENCSDIKYNFMVGGDGTIYEGRGWLVDSDRPPEMDHLKGNCIDIALIGDHDDDDQFHPDFPEDIADKMAYVWAVHGQQGKNYVKWRFKTHEP